MSRLDRAETTLGHEKTGCIAVIPCGDVPASACKAIAAHIETHFRLRAEVFPPIQSPHYAHDPERQQYNAMSILNNLESSIPPGFLKSLVIVNVDLFIPVFTHVFGEAREGGTCALASLYRLGSVPGALSPAGHQILERLSKVALHEIAHLFDLAHCRDNDCVMHFTMSLKELDAIPVTFCKYCSSFLQQSIRRLGRCTSKNRGYSKADSGF